MSADPERCPQSSCPLKRESAKLWRHLDYERAEIELERDPIQACSHPDCPYRLGS